MLKKFFLNVLSSFVGMWVALALFGVAALIVCIGMFARLGADASVGNTSVGRNSVLKIDLSGSISESERPAEFDVQTIASKGQETSKTLRQLVTAIREAKENKNIKAMYVECNGVNAGPATLNALRAAITDFRKSGKMVIAYGDNYSQADYIVASAADSVLINPEGMISLKGLSGTSLFLKDLFDKIGVEFQVFKVGTFKSAVEPYIQNEMSAPAKAQLDTLYTVMWKEIKKQIGASRDIDPAMIDTLINRDHVTFRRAKFYVAQKIVDRTEYKRNIDGVFGSILGVDADKVSYVEPSILDSQTDWGSAYGSRRQVAVLYATGEIEEGTTGGIDCEKLVPQIVDLAEDDNVKAVVLRINSPGGSVFGTVQIAEALRYLKSKDKPLIVSMGDYAASGGYWLSCECDYIYADALTITGSIGIFGLIPQMSGLMGKLGVNPQTVATNPGADFPDVFHAMDNSQKAAMQQWIEEGYDRFIAQVAKGRKMKESKVRQIAQGRVWNAMTAKKLGLVDNIGSLEDAVAYAAKKADLEDNYDIAVYPLYEPSFWDMIPQLQQNMLINLQTALPYENEVMLNRVSRILLRKPQQARMVEITVNV